MKQRVKLKRIIARWRQAQLDNPFAENWIPIGYYKNRPGVIKNMTEVGIIDRVRYIELPLLFGN